MKWRPGVTVVMASLIAVFAVEQSRGAVGHEEALIAMGALPDSGALHGGYWRLVTHAFLHLTPLHLVANLAGLWWAGNIVERRLGTWRTLLVYFVAALAGGIAEFSA